MENKKPIIAIVVLSVLCLILFIAYMSSLAKVKNSDDNIALATENEELAKENKLLQSEVDSLTSDNEQLQSELDSAKDALKEAREASTKVADYDSANEATEEPEETPEEPTEAPEKNSEKKKLSYDDFDVATKNACDAARDHLKYSTYSRKKLIERMTSDRGDGYSEDQTITAIKYLEQQKEVDWMEQAVRSAEDHITYGSYSRKKLIERMTSERGDGFTQEQAEYAADQVGLTE